MLRGWVRFHLLVETLRVEAHFKNIPMAEGEMATAKKEKAPRPKLVARPQPDADLKAISAEITERYKKTLAYLGR